MEISVSKRISFRENDMRPNGLFVIYCDCGKARKRARTGSVHGVGKTSISPPALAHHATLSSDQAD